jgi:hypothetical protein
MNAVVRHLTLENEILLPKIHFSALVLHRKKLNVGASVDSPFGCAVRILN